MRTRSLAALMVAVSSLFALPAAAFATPLNLRDVPAGDPDRVAIEFLNRHEVVYGSVDGMFDPDANITRGEILKIALEASGEGRAALLTSSDGSGRFSDVPATHTLGSYITYASEKGYISGYSDGTFKPDNLVTRAEGAKILANILKANVASSSGTYSDVNASTLKPFIESLAAANWYRPAPPIFNPGIPMLRREVAQATYRAIVAVNEDPSKVYTQSMMAPMSAVTDWQPAAKVGISVLVPPQWSWDGSEETKDGVTLHAIAAFPSAPTDNTVEPTFGLVSADAAELATLEGGSGKDIVTDPVDLLIAVDGAQGPTTVKAIESHDLTKGYHIVVWANVSTKTVYMALYAERTTPGLTSTFYRFVQHAMDLDMQST